MATSPKTTDESSVIEAAARILQAKEQEKATLAEAEMALARLAATPPPDVVEARLQMGTKILVQGVLAAQVNPLTCQRIDRVGLTSVAYDRWIEIQLEHGVLKRVEA